MSQELSSIQGICFRKTSVSNEGETRQTRILSGAPSNLVTRVSLNSCNDSFLAAWYHAVITPTPLPAKSGFQTWQRIVLLLVFIS